MSKTLKPAFGLVFFIAKENPAKFRALCRSVAALWTALIKILFYQCNILLTLPLLEGLRSFSIKKNLGGQPPLFCEENHHVTNYRAGVAGTLLHELRAKGEKKPWKVAQMSSRANVNVHYAKITGAAPAAELN
ncbi:Uncharacterised protein [Serratia fonticola]|uniref:Uncharacterized protein n=1 Tax=Serratia fonticola TaxID=47917 RepID=A0A4U9T8D1_SERFO|nr:Uncharacterised protein [Serratia fonticola]